MERLLTVYKGEEHFLKRLLKISMLLPIYFLIFLLKDDFGTIASIILSLILTAVVLFFSIRLLVSFIKVPYELIKVYDTYLELYVEDEYTKLELIEVVDIGVSLNNPNSKKLNRKKTGSIHVVTVNDEFIVENVKNPVTNARKIHKITKEYQEKYKKM